MLIAARQKGTELKFMIPPIDLTFSDDANLAESRMKLAI